MMRTEEQATQSTWCQMSRDGANCIATKCMMWRWGQEEDQDTGRMIPVRFQTTEQWECEHCKGTGISQYDLGGEEGVQDGCCVECEGQSKGFKYAPAGYCGLAGKP